MARMRGRSFERTTERIDSNAYEKIEERIEEVVIDFERDGIREGDNIRDPEGVLDTTLTEDEQLEFILGHLSTIKFEDYSETINKLSLENKLMLIHKASDAFEFEFANKVGLIIGQGNDISNKIEFLKVLIDYCYGEEIEDIEKKIFAELNEEERSLIIEYIGSKHIIKREAYAWMLEEKTETAEEDKTAFEVNLSDETLAQEDETHVDTDNIDDIDFDDDFDLDEAVANIEIDTFDFDISQEETIYSTVEEKKPQVVNKEVVSNQPKPKQKQRVDSRNNGIKISKGLEEKLGTYNTNGINILVNFEKMIKQQLELSSCSDEMRIVIAEKMVGLTDLLAKIYKITKSHKSNDVKKEKLENLLDGVSVVALCGKLSEEIEATRKTLINKAKEAAKNINENIVEEAEQKNTLELSAEEGVAKEPESEVDVEESKEEKLFNPETDIPSFRRGTSLTPEDQKMIDNLIGREGSDEKFSPEDIDKLFDVESDKEEKALIKPEKVGFFGRIKRFFVELKEAYNIGKNAGNSSKEVSKNSEKSSTKNNGEYTKAGFSVMGKIKNILDSVLEDKSGREVTPNVIENISQRVATFSQDKKIGDMCKGIVKDVWEFTNAITYNVGDYVVEGTNRGIATIRNAKDEKGR